ncbi:peptidase M24, structural domain-containing protein [Aspergillus spinulosporus]
MADRRNVLRSGCGNDAAICNECFKRNWTVFDHSAVNGLYRYFPSFSFSGTIRPVYLLSSMHWAVTGISFDILDVKEQEDMWMVCRLAREVLYFMAAEIKPGVTIDYLDEICHNACIERDGRATLFRADLGSVRVLETRRECLDLANELVKPGTPIRRFGRVIEKHARSRNCNNKAVGVCKSGITFPIEPILALAISWVIYWPADWAKVTADGKRSAQFEHTLLVTETGVEVLTARNAHSPGGLALLLTMNETTEAI